MSFDTIIIGAGTAGCLLANRLSANRGRQVLLLEAGGRDDYHWIHIPIGYLHCIGNPRTDWMYRTEPEPGLGGRQLRYPRGKVLGGSSSINGMIYMRGQAADYEHWSELTGDDAWRWGHVLPFFKQHEHHWRLAQPGADEAFRALHGQGGEWRVNRQRQRWEILDAFADAAVQAGLPRRDDFNGGDNEGVGYFEVNQHQGLRWNAAKAFLRPTCLGRPNFELWTGSTVQRLLFDTDASGQTRCVGAEVRTPHGPETVRLNPGGELLLAAGAIGSPQVLQLSGLGPADLLQAHGIPVLQDIPGVGANLQDHLQLRTVFKVQGTRTLNTRAASWWGRAGIGLEYLLRRSGPMSMAPSQLGIFTRSSAAQARPDLQFHVQPLSLDAFGEPLHRFDAFTASVCHLQPESRGSVQIRSADPQDAPRIAPNYLSTEGDRRIAAASLRVARHIAAQPALARFQPEECRPGPALQSDEALVQAAAEIGTTIFHPVGTCKMGRADDPMAVLDSHCRVRGVAGLRVVDASAMPRITSGNTSAPVLMVAERVAAWVRGGDED